MKKAHPDSQLIDALGGTSVVANMCEVKPPSVSEWREKGIPKARLMYLRLARPDLFEANEEKDTSHNPQSSMPTPADVTGQAAYAEGGGHV